MRFKIKTDDVEVLEKYGFKLPEEWLASGALEDTNVSEHCMMKGCFYIYQMDEENPSKIAVADEVGNPLFEAWIDTREGRNILWFSIRPFDSFYSSMDELLPMMDIIYQLTKDGLLERIENNGYHRWPI